MKMNKITTSLAAMLMLSSVLPMNSALAAEAQNYQHEQLSKSYVSLGVGVNEQQKLEEVLGKKDGDVVFTTNGNDVYKKLGIPDIDDSQVHSSVRVSPAQEDAGTLVNIVEYEGKNNITMITPQQYAMAAAVSGIKDVVITVSSDKPIGGQGALAGLYQALEKDGQQLDRRNIVPANQLLSATQEPIKNNDNDKTYAGKLTSAILETSGNLAADDKRNTLEEAKTELTKSLENKNIDNKTGEDNIEEIAKVLVIIDGSAPIAKTSSYSKQVKKASGILKGSVGSIMAKSSDFLDASTWDKVSSFFSKAIDFFIGLYDKVVAFFAKDDNKAPDETTKKKDDNSVSENSTDYNEQTGEAVSSELLKRFDNWDGTKEGTISTVNNNKATFTMDEMEQQFKIKGDKSTRLNPVNGLQLSDLDSLGRSRVANAYITPESMSGTDKRIPIPASSAPSGWYNGATYDVEKHMWKGGHTNNKKLAGSGYIYNKSHLVGWQFFDNNKAPNDVNGVMSIYNLVTGTRVQNADPGQLRYENMIAKVVKERNIAVRYQVTPIYDGNELVPRMTHLIAKSVDDGKTIEFNVVILNVQPNVTIDYNTGVATEK